MLGHFSRGRNELNDIRARDGAAPDLDVAFEREDGAVAQDIRVQLLGVHDALAAAQAREQWPDLGGGYVDADHALPVVESLAA